MNSDPMPTPWLTWKPSKDTAAAVFSVVLFMGGYYGLTHINGVPGTIYSFIVLSLTVAFPVWWLCWYQAHGLGELGIHGRNVISSAVISILLSSFFMMGVMKNYGSLGEKLLPHLLVNATVFWEPFFVHGWLQLRYERAFGILPGLLLTGISFGAYHLGTYPIAGVFSLMVYGFVFAILFRLSGNLLILWPLAWTASSTIGTLEGKMLFGWGDLPSSIGILLIQMLIIGWTWKNIRTRENPSS